MFFSTPASRKRYLGKLISRRSAPKCTPTLPLLLVLFGIVLTESNVVVPSRERRPSNLINCLSKVSNSRIKLADQRKVKRVTSSHGVSFQTFLVCTGAPIKLRIGELSEIFPFYATISSNFSSFEPVLSLSTLPFCHPLHHVYDLKSLAVPLSNTRSLTDTLKNTYACIFHITRSTFPSTFSKFPSYGEIYIALPPNNFPRFNEGRKENVSREDRIVSSRER